MNRPIGDFELLPALPAGPAPPPGVNRRAFLVRNAAIGAAAILTGQTWTPQARAQRAAAEASAARPGTALSPDLYIVKEEKGPVLTVLEEFYKVGPGPSSSHTVGPMRAARAFLSRASHLAGRVARVEVTLYGSLAWTGKGHGTDVAVLAGLAGMQPATADPDAVHTLPATVAAAGQIDLAGIGPVAFDATRDLLFDRATPTPEHPNTMRLRLFDATGTVLGAETWFSVGGGFVVRQGEEAAEAAAASIRSSSARISRSRSRRSSIGTSAAASFSLRWMTTRSPRYSTRFSTSESELRRPMTLIRSRPIVVSSQIVNSFARPRGRVPPAARALGPGRSSH